jgi:acyl carrier protein
MKWTQEALQRDVLTIFEKHVSEGVTPTADSQIVADLGLDSLAVMEVIADLEDLFGLTIPDEALQKIETIQDVSAALASSLVEEGKLE